VRTMAAFKRTYNDRKGNPRETRKWYCEFKDQKEVLRRWPTFTSVVRHAVCILSRTARARRTFARIVSALAVQTKAVGSLLCLAM
jgi:hypothetical protein